MAGVSESTGEVKPIYVRVSRSQEVFGLHRSTIYRLSARGKITIHKLGAVALVRVDEMERLIEGRKEEAAA